jgi:metallo-beta-lactamase family protein
MTRAARRSTLCNQHQQEEFALKLSFHGADRTVTGSCHMIEAAGKRILIDCGLFQGGREMEEENGAPFGFDPASVDFVLLTHAHLDHCGRLPLLAKRGFRGEIVSTAATAELARLVMVDSAHLQEEEARWRAKKAAKHGGKAKPVAPLYSLIDTLNSISHFGRTARYGETIELAKGLTATFVNAGHILGSASVLLELEEQGRKKTVLFSGDLGKDVDPLLLAPAKPPHADNVVIETTYGNRNHKPLAPSIEEFYDAVTETFQRGGNVVIPTFAVERAQELLHVISDGIAKLRLPPQTQVFMDSPMAISVTEIMQRNLSDLQPEIAEDIRQGNDPFHFEGLHMTRDQALSMAINEVKSGAIIMAGAGMCTGGRIRHHLKHNLPRSECSIVFVGFAAAGTLARRIIDGEKEVRIFGDWYPVKAKVYTINGFSAHADQQQLLAWLGRVSAPRTFLVHGEEATMAGFAGLLKGTQVEQPKLEQVYDL